MNKEKLSDDEVKMCEQTLQKTIEHFEERLRYAVIGGSTAISTVHARLALKVLKEIKRKIETGGTENE